MKNNQEYLSLLMMVGDDMGQLQENCCGVLEEDICERHDPIMGELEAVFRKAAGWEDDNTAIEVAWQRLELAIQDMYMEMVLASFVVGIRYGAGLIGVDGVGENGRLVEVPVHTLVVEV